MTDAAGRPPLTFLIVVLVVAIALAILLRRSDDGSPAGADGSPRPSATEASESATNSVGRGPTLPTCAYEDERAPNHGYDRWRWTVLDTRFAIARSYEPPDLVSVRRAGFPGTQTTRSFVIHDLAGLRRAAAAAGNPIDIIWSYRSYRTQERVFQHSVDLKGYDKAVLTAARPGHSEHQLGTVFDFKTEGAQDVYKNWASQPAGAWMQENAWRYGFVMSYPRGEKPVTCYAYEPWHYRYLGKPLALKVHASGLSLREYLWGHGGDA